MSAQKRTMVYFDETIRMALRLKAAETGQSISELVNTAVRSILAEDADDLAAFRERAREPTTVFEDLVRDLKQRRKL